MIRSLSKASVPCDLHTAVRQRIWRLVGKKTMDAATSSIRFGSEEAANRSEVSLASAQSIRADARHRPERQKFIVLVGWLGAKEKDFQKCASLQFSCLIVFRKTYFNGPESWLKAYCLWLLQQYRHWPVPASAAAIRSERLTIIRMTAGMCSFGKALGTGRLDSDQPQPA